MCFKGIISLSIQRKPMKWIFFFYYPYFKDREPGHGGIEDCALAQMAKK